MNTTGFVLADVHVEVTNKKFLAAILDAVAEEKPTWLVWLGDIADFASCSRHVSQFDQPSLQSELDQVAELFATVERRSPATTQYWAEGNHELFVRRYLTEKAPSVRDSLRLDRWVAKSFPRIKWIPEKSILSFGKLSLVHGHQFMRAFPPKQFSARLADLYARPGHTVICGHTHKAQFTELPHYFGVRRGIGLGAVRTVDAAWDPLGPASGWVNEFAHVRMNNSQPDVDVIGWKDGRFRLRDKYYGRR